MAVSRWFAHQWPVSSPQDQFPRENHVVDHVTLFLEPLVHSRQEYGAPLVNKEQNVGNTLFSAHPAKVSLVGF